LSGTNVEINKNFVGVRA